MGLTLDLRNEKIYLANITTNEIIRLNLDGTGREHVFSAVFPTAITLDLKNNKIYWGGGATADTGYLMRANLDGSDLEVILDGIWAVGCIAVDEVHQKIYWTGGSKVRRANLDGTNFEELVVERKTFGIALDVAQGKMYWGQWEPDRIIRANLDGSNEETIVELSAHPIGIALDLKSRRVYWSYPVMTIEGFFSATLDGSDLQSVFVPAVPRRIDLDLRTSIPAVGGLGLLIIAASMLCAGGYILKRRNESEVEA